MANRVTIQDIADALGISRNTVSKAINNSPGLADSTREKILQKATEMGYKQFSYVMTQNLGYNNASHPDNSPNSAFALPEQIPEITRPAQIKEIALFTEGFLGSSHFATTMLDKFQREISQLGYSLSIHHLTSEEVKKRQLPLTFSKERTSGIMSVELFDADYVKMLCNLDIPLLLVDAPVDPMSEPFPADLLIMDNTNGIATFIKHMLDKGYKEIGFIGHAEHCRSFFERFMAYRNAMYLYGGELKEEFCLVDTYKGMRYPTSEDYRSYIKEELLRLDHLPQIFVCANDFVALDVLIVCKELGYSVPDDLMLCGFDDSPESKVISPPLTTVHIHSQIMGFSAVHLLMSRIKEPSLYFRTISTESNLIYRESAPE